MPEPVADRLEVLGRLAGGVAGHGRRVDARLGQARRDERPPRPSGRVGARQEYAPAASGQSRPSDAPTRAGRRTGCRICRTRSSSSDSSRGSASARPLPPGPPTAIASVPRGVTARAVDGVDDPDRRRRAAVVIDRNEHAVARRASPGGQGTNHGSGRADATRTPAPNSRSGGISRKIARPGASTSGMNTPSARAAAASRQRIASIATPTRTDAISQSAPSMPADDPQQREMSASRAAPSQSAATRPTTTASDDGPRPPSRAIRRPSPTRRSAQPARSARHAGRPATGAAADRGCGSTGRAARRRRPRSRSGSSTGSASRSQRTARTAPMTSEAIRTDRATIEPGARRPGPPRS